MTLSKTIAALLCATALIVQGEFAWEDYYSVEKVQTPEGVDPQFGGLAMTKSGEMAACFHRGEVMIYNFETKKWRLFASGLHEPLGIYAEDDGSILVIQRPELTRLKDTDGDGKADVYQTLCDDWGLSGNYHEFTFGLVKDSRGNLFISLGTASNGSGVREEIRGEWNDAGGLTQDKFLYGGEYGDWKELKELNKIPRMYARVPYRGCVLKIKPDSRKAEVYATGTRTPNGLYMDKDDQLWVTDNQGDWVGSSKIHRIEKGGFHGHVASLLWADDPVTDAVPSLLPTEKLEKHRIKGAGVFPQGDAANSITQMLGIKKGFAPVGQDDRSIIIGEMNTPRLLHYFKDEVKGVHQGGACHILDTTVIGAGNNRLLYTADEKTLYLGKTHLSWPGRPGMKKVTYNGKPYLMAEHMKLTPEGFAIEFNSEIEKLGKKEDYRIVSYGQDYNASYGSKKVDEQTEELAEIKADGKTLTISLGEKPRPELIYYIWLSKDLESKLSKVSSWRYWYAAHEVYD